MSNILGAPTISYGTSGEWVKIAQQMLKNAGILLPKYGVDGKFGAETRTAVMQFQDIIGLTTDGAIGDLTWSYLYQVQSQGSKDTASTSAQSASKTETPLPPPTAVQDGTPTKKLAEMFKGVDWTVVGLVGVGAFILLSVLAPKPVRVPVRRRKR